MVSGQVSEAVVPFLVGNEGEGMAESHANYSNVAVVSAPVLLTTDTNTYSNTTDHQHLWLWD